MQRHPRRFGLAVPNTVTFYTANHKCAILDMVFASLVKKKLPAHVVANEFNNSKYELTELKSKVQKLKKYLVKLHSHFFILGGNQP